MDMFSKILTISKFTIIESLRNRLLWLSLLVVAISFGLVEFIGDLAITEHRVTQVSVLGAFLRLSAVVIVTMFVVSSTVRAVSYTHLTLPTNIIRCISRWSPYH